MPRKRNRPSPRTSLSPRSAESKPSQERKKPRRATTSYTLLKKASHRLGSSNNGSRTPRGNAKSKTETRGGAKDAKPKRENATNNFTRQYLRGRIVKRIYKPICGHNSKQRSGSMGQLRNTKTPQRLKTKAASVSRLKIAQGSKIKMERSAEPQPGPSNAEDTSGNNAVIHLPPRKTDHCFPHKTKSPQKSPTAKPGPSTERNRSVISLNNTLANTRILSARARARRHQNRNRRRRSLEQVKKYKVNQARRKKLRSNVNDELWEGLPFNLSMPRAHPFPFQTTFPLTSVKTEDGAGCSNANPNANNNSDNLPVIQGNCIIEKTEKVGNSQSEEYIRTLLESSIESNPIGAIEITPRDIKHISHVYSGCDGYRGTYEPGKLYDDATLLTHRSLDGPESNITDGGVDIEHNSSTDNYEEENDIETSQFVAAPNVMVKQEDMCSSLKCLSLEDTLGKYPNKTLDFIEGRLSQGSTTGEYIVHQSPKKKSKLANTPRQNEIKLRRSARKKCEKVPHDASFVSTSNKIDFSKRLEEKLSLVKVESTDQATSIQTTDGQKKEFGRCNILDSLLNIEREKQSPRKRKKGVQNDKSSGSKEEDQETNTREKNSCPKPGPSGLCQQLPKCLFDSNNSERLSSTESDPSANLTCDIKEDTPMKLFIRSKPKVNLNEEKLDNLSKEVNIHQLINKTPDHPKGGQEKIHTRKSKTPKRSFPRIKLTFSPGRNNKPIQDQASLSCEIKLEKSDSCENVSVEPGTTNETLSSRNHDDKIQEIVASTSQGATKSALRTPAKNKGNSVFAGSKRTSPKKSFRSNSTKTPRASSKNKSGSSSKSAPLLKKAKEAYWRDQDQRVKCFKAQKRKSLEKSDTNTEKSQMKGISREEDVRPVTDTANKASESSGFDLATESDGNQAISGRRNVTSEIQASPSSPPCTGEGKGNEATQIHARTRSIESETRLLTGLPVQRQRRKKDAGLAPAELLNDVRLGLHACSLWSSDNRRHFQLKNPVISSSDLDALMRNEWELLAKKEKVQYYRRAYNATDEKKRTQKVPKENKPKENTAKKKETKEDMFYVLHPNQQDTLLRQKLMYFQRHLSSFHYEEFIRGYRTSFMSSVENMRYRKDRPNCTYGENARDDSEEGRLDRVARRLLYSKIKDLEPRVNEIRLHKKFIKVKQNEEKLEILAWDLIQGLPVEFEEDCHSEHLTEIIEAMMNVENSTNCSDSKNAITKVDGVGGASTNCTCLDQVEEDRVKKIERALKSHSGLCSNEFVINKETLLVPDIPSDSKINSDLLRSASEACLPDIQEGLGEYFSSLAHNDTSGEETDAGSSTLRQVEGLEPLDAAHVAIYRQLHGLESCCELESTSCVLNYLLVDEMLQSEAFVN